MNQAKTDGWSEIALGVLVVLLGVAIFVDPIFDSLKLPRINFGKNHELFGFAIGLVGLLLVRSGLRKIWKRGTNSIRDGRS